MANNYKVKMVDLQNKYKFKIFCSSQMYDDTDLKREVEAIYKAFPKASSTGTDASLDGTAAAMMNIDLKGNTSQETTTGKQLFNIDGTLYAGSIDKVNNGFKLTNNATYRTLSIILPQEIPAGTYKITYTPNNSTLSNINKVSGSLRSSNNTQITSFTLNSNNEVTVSPSQAIGRMYIFIASEEESGVTITLDDFMISASGGDYEPYTGGIASPNPSYPQDVNVVTGDNTIYVEAKNLLNVSATEVGKAWNGNSATNRAVVYTRAEPNTTYTISYQSKNGNDSLYYFEKINKTDTTNLSGVNAINFERTITTNASTKWLGIQINKEAITYNDVAGTKLQIEKGSTASDYETYQSQSYNVNLGTLELCKIEDYQDYIYKDNKKWYKKKQINKITLNGTEEWYVGSSATNRSVFANQTTFIDRKDTSSFNDFFCDNFSYRGNAQGQVLGYAMSFNSGQYTRFIYVQVPLDVVAQGQIEDFKTWLSNHNSTIYYILATPTTEEITDATLISQLEALRNAESYEGQTNISQTNNDLPFIITASAIKDLSNL